MDVFAVGKHDRPEDAVSFSTVCEVQSSPLAFTPNQAFVSGLLQWQASGEILFSGLRSPELST